MRKRLDKGQLYVSMISLYFGLSFFSEGLTLIGHVPSKIMAIYKAFTVILVVCVLALLMFKTKYIPKIDFYIFIAFIGLNVLAILVSYKRYGLIEARGVVNFCVGILNCLIFYFFIRAIPLSKRHINYNLICFYFIIVSSCIFNLIIYHEDISKLFSTKYRAYEINIVGPFGNRNTFASYLFIGVVVGNLLIKFNNKYKIQIIVTNIFLLFNLLLTLSRTATIGTVIFLIISFVFTKKLSIRQKVMLLAVGVLGLAVVKSTSLWEFVRQKLIRKQHGNTGRTEIWLAALKLNSNIFEVLFGVGYGAKNAKLIEIIGRASEHNTFLELYNLGGVLLLGLMVFFKGKLVMQSLKIKNKEYSISILAFQLGIIFTMFFERYLFLGTTAESQLIFYLFVTLPTLSKVFDENKNKNYVMPYAEQYFTRIA